MDFTPTPGQERLIDNLIMWYNDKNRNPCYSYSGAAGTGKTTVFRAFIDRLGLEDDEYICAAYVGKAVLQLLRNNLPACTIHSLIYRLMIVPVYPKEADMDQTVKYKMTFILRESLSPNLKVIFIDEATMVNDQMRNELLSFGLPVIFAGDMNQLPPIFGVSSVMLYPDFSLTQIMRQAENDPIIQLSQMILNDEPLWIGNYGISRVVDSYDVDASLVNDYDIIICAKNATRDTLNTGIRMDVLNRKSADPVIGDKLICRQNNWNACVDDIFLTNGLIGYATDVSRMLAYKGCYTIGFRPDFMTSSFEDIPLDLKYIRANIEERSSFGMSKFNKFEYGYVITAHLSQGSGYDRVLFIDESFYDKELTKKMRYTAITRAAEQITIVAKYPRYRKQYPFYDMVAKG